MTDHNPYAAPAATGQPASLSGPGSPVRAVLLGLLVDLGGTMLVGILFVIGYAMLLGASGLPAGEIEARMGAIGHDTPVGLALTAVGALLSLLGGYVCARVARASELRVALVMAAVSCGVGVLASVGSSSLPVTLALAVLSLGAILGGATLGRRRNRREAAGQSG